MKTYHQAPLAKLETAAELCQEAHTPPPPHPNVALRNCQILGSHHSCSESKGTQEVT